MRVIDQLRTIPADGWDRLAAAAAEDSSSTQPFVRHAYLEALERAGCVGPGTGWHPCHLTLWDGQDRLCAAAPLYLKAHSYGEYVFDWAWADAYRRHGLRYYPKLLGAVPFTPVTGPRLLARDNSARDALIGGLASLARTLDVSSTHLLFAHGPDIERLAARGMMIRQGVQFHWQNRGYPDFGQFLSALSQSKRKKIRAERRKVNEAGVGCRRIPGGELREADWDHFHRCYEATYLAHGSTPYLNREFFGLLGERLRENLTMTVAERGGRPLAASLIMHDERRMYGRYWGALEAVPCLHFEVAYYQTIEAAIASGHESIEGGAQGEHKLARGFEPVTTYSAHWLARPGFADAVSRFLARETGMLGGYLDELNDRLPFRPALGDGLE